MGIMRLAAWVVVVTCVTGAGAVAAPDDDLGTPPAAQPAAQPGVQPGVQPADVPAPDVVTPDDVGPAQTEILHLSLLDCVRMGVEANLTLQAARYDEPIAHAFFQAADAGFDRLLTAGFDVAQTETRSSSVFTGTGNVTEDSFRLETGISRQLRSGGSVAVLYQADRVDTNSAIIGINPSWRSGVAVEASQPLLRGAGRIALTEVRRAQVGIRAARANFETQFESLLIGIVSGYWELVYSDDNLDARRKSEEVAKELLADEEARLETDIGTSLAVSEASAGLQRRKSERLQAENLRGSTEDVLRQLIMPFSVDRSPVRIQPTDSSERANDGALNLSDEDRFVHMALRGRPELQGRRADITTRGLDMVEAHDAIKPQLNAVGRLASDGLDGDFGASMEDVLTGRAFSASIGVQFSVYLGQRAARANWRAAGWARRQALLRYRETENEIIVEVRSALRDLDTAGAQLTAGRAEVAAAQEAVEGEQDKKDGGQSTPFRVLQKEDDLTSARTRLGRAAADLRIAESRLWKAAGALAQNLGVKAPSWPGCCEPGR